MSSSSEASTSIKALSPLASYSSLSVILGASKGFWRQHTCNKSIRWVARVEEREIHWIRTKPLKKGFIENFHYCILNINQTRKSHTCEEGGAHPRIFVSHLLMNLKNNYLLKNCWRGPIKNVSIWIFTKIKKIKKNKEKHLKISLFYTCVPTIFMIWSTFLEI